MTGRLVIYVDTSALGALLIEQPESAALVEWLDQTSAVLVSSDLTETELRRIAVREGLEQADVTLVLDGVALAVRAGERYPGLRVLLVSGYTGQHANEDANLARRPLLPKPFTQTDLLYAVRRTLDTK